MIGGEFDLSFGSMIGTAGMVLAIPIALYGRPLWVALRLALAAQQSLETGRVIEIRGPLEARET